MNDTKKISVIIVDDNPSAIEGVKLLLSTYNKFKVIATFNNGEELLNYNNIHICNIILMDIEMPVMGGIEAAKRISFLYPDTKMIAITMYQHRLYLRDILSAGFHGFVNKGRMAEDLNDTINKVNSNKRHYPKDLNI